MVPHNIIKARNAWCVFIYILGLVQLILLLAYNVREQIKPYTRSKCSELTFLFEWPLFYFWLCLFVFVLYVLQWQMVACLNGRPVHGNGKNYYPDNIYEF